ncbi:Hemolysin-type calcium-binding region [Gloeothece citriformis PCC 7424]|uniref:Hemolysin-type calcium-binding region n=1 Tax=Gloeothece citriformis (strain PCC 7424) TaxID=65393 RepID=B7KA39_GLOC7|nr:hemolysin-type calcium-binding protein [Gloeothece citriformis]ACK71395.1 Hemolysin-type calcium-binding region [Gloeothece citriformis PCC 7424]
MNNNLFPYSENSLLSPSNLFSGEAHPDDEHNHNGEIQPLLTVADFNGDGQVNFSDFQDLIPRIGSAMGEEKYHFLYDLNVDEKIDFNDVILAARTWGQSVPLLDQQIAKATQATMRYYGPNGLQNAIADGYLPFTPEAKGHGIHYYNPLLASQVGNLETLDIEHPVGLNYNNQGELVAVFYIRLPKTGQPTEENPLGGLLVDPNDNHPPHYSFEGLTHDDWHHHHSAWVRGIGNLNPEQVYFEEDVPLPLVVSRLENLENNEIELFPNSDQLYNPMFWMLHGWFHSPNPDGTFGTTNPLIAPHALSELGVHGEGHNEPNFDLIPGTDLGEQLIGTSQRERINGFDGDDYINGRDGDDWIWGGYGKDTIIGGHGNDMIYAGPDDDIIYGGKNDDRLFGGSGDDKIWGGQGDDLIRGGLGNDTLWGDYTFEQQGQDRFVLSPEEGTDTIKDFQVQIDKLVLEGGLDRTNLSITQHSNNTWVGLLNNQTTLAILMGVDAIDLTSDSFISA